MQEHVRLAMRRKHAERFEDCVCGRRIWGNGRASHYRACRQHLREVGYPLDEGLRSAIREAHGVGVVAEVEKRLGVIAAERKGNYSAGPRPDLRSLRWIVFRDLVWSIADEVAEGSK
jgi:hypothetical protein